MIVEIASPPGGGKTSVIMTLSMNARVGVEGDITEDEVLVIGESYVAQGGSLFLIPTVLDARHGGQSDSR